MEIKHLEAFVALVQSRKYSKAAKSLYISQSTLSKRILELEEELGEQLFERTWQQITLTEAGAAFQPKALAAIAAFYNLHLSEVDFQKHISVGVARQIMNNLDLLASLRESERRFSKKDQVYSTLCLTTMAEAEQAIASGTMDAAVLLSHDQPDFPDLKVRMLFETPMCVVYKKIEGRKNLSSAEEICSFLENRSLFLYDSQMRSVMHLYLILSELGIRAVKMISVENETVAVMRLLEEDGACIIPRSHIGMFLSNDRICAELLIADVPAESAKIFTFLAWKDGNVQAENMVNEITDCIEEERIWEKWGQENALVTAR